MIVLFTIFRTLYIYLNGEKMNLFICFLSGIATSLGYFFCYLKIEKNKLIASTLAFASSIMFFMSLLELIPEGIAIIKAHYMIPTSILMISLFFTIGILIALSINNIIKNNEDNLYKVGIYTAIGLIIHNILEGFITYLTLKIDTEIGLKMALSITLHNIPEGISIAIPLFYSINGRKKLFKSLLLLSSSEVLGAILAFTIFKNVELKIVGELYLIIAGIMSFIAIFELLKESLHYKLNKLAIMSFIIGFFLVLILKFL